MWTVSQELTETTRELLMKIKRLAEDPAAQPGERAAAERKLDSYLERLGLSRADLEEETRHLVWYKARNETEEKLYHQQNDGGDVACTRAEHPAGSHRNGRLQDQERQRAGPDDIHRRCTGMSPLIALRA